MSRLMRYAQDSRFLLAEDIGNPTELKAKGWTPNNVPGIGVSPFGPTGLFNGANPDFWTIPNTGLTHTVYNATANYLTVMAWVNSSNLALSNGIMAMNGTASGWFFYISHSNDEAYLTLKGLGMNAVSFYNTDSVIEDEWTHLACSFTVDTGTIGNNLGTMYVNGDATNTAVLRSLDPVTVAENVTIGARQGPTIGMRGGIAYPMIVEGALSAAEIMSIAKGRAF